jgi:uncharacterized LabA/DUF88 family protein
LIDQRLKIAVFIDFDNIEIGVKTTLHTQFDIAAILDGIKERGEVVTKVAYGDWKRAGDYGRMMSQHAIRMVQRNLTPGGDKNGADINLALDALEMAFTHDHINAFVIVGGDSDFITLVEKLKQYDKKVFVVGGRQFTSQVMQKNCHEFIAYENLISRDSRRPPVAVGPGPRRDNGAPAAAASADVAKAIPLVKRALKVLTDREVSPQLGLLKSTLLQLDSTFSERDYGVSTFRDFIEKVAKTGLVTLRHSGRSMMVDAVDALDGVEATDASAAAQPAINTVAPTPAPAAASAAPTNASPTAAADPEQVQQMLDATRDIFNRATQQPRWPMYVRQLKQFIRSVDQTFDERKWGFATVMEFLRVAQREGIFRLERDRRGQIRVFSGSALQSAPIATASASAAIEQEREVNGNVYDADVNGQSYNAEPVDTSDSADASESVSRVESDLTADSGFDSDMNAGSVNIEADREEPPVAEVIEIDETPAPAKPRRTRKAPTAGKPAARKSTGARTATPRRRKAPAA